MPILVELMPYREAVDCLASLPKAMRFCLLDSANHLRPEGERNRYSYLGMDPFLLCEARHDGVRLDGVLQSQRHALTVLAALMAQGHLEPLPDLPPFQGGAMGYLAYDLCQQLEAVPLAQGDAFDWPLAALGFYDLLLSFDHRRERCWLVSTGMAFDATGVGEGLGRITVCEMRAKHRLALAKSWLSQPPRTLSCKLVSPMQSHDTQASYEAMVEAVKAHILAGDVFEVNVAQAFEGSLPEGVDHLALYARLRAVNPAPFSGYMPWGTYQLLSASPECFLTVSGKMIETRPIKGTRPRGHDVQSDKVLAKALCLSEKDRAENVMIVDLMRNDLSRICEPHSVVVPQLCGLESFETVHHLVSVVQGQLQPGVGLVDVITASFPGGSITGAPKIRAMAIIAELEKTRRGPYCGSMGYLGFDGSMVLSILIRTLLGDGQCLRFHVGGAVTLGSDPREEYQETLDKAKGLLAALQ